VYQRLEKGNNADYWQDITVIVEDELHKLRKLDSRTGSQYEAAVERREGINKAVLTDVQHIFRGTSTYMDGHYRQWTLTFAPLLCQYLPWDKSCQKVRYLNS
jgi:hypothetical protein